ncbi:MotA/TolQ/ExbB proton channel family protein [Lamprobacter modestohalophilus]|uniref:MotA/TolQ/ExbB proton channel family protein n=1 Tax=Lamprobacter modestohalophilus TaxID=1064514 RepID=UPI002ADEF251|nr:MotA/TolQ/ExbB proton channel family protein [Lamprobacter modestohalophilus]MEA1051828.1 MotA/TolQ/ExbB proton channel family protein [Lamprobacter modestohalophilus]
MNDAQADISTADIPLSAEPSSAPASHLAQPLKASAPERTADQSANTEAESDSASPALSSEPAASAAPEHAEPAAADAMLPDATAVEPQSWLEGLANLSEPLRETVGNGGPVLMVLTVLSIVALTIVLAKLWQFARLHLDTPRSVEAALQSWSRDQPAAALATLGDRRQPTARLVAQAIRGLQQVRNQPPAALELLREELRRAANAQLEQLRSWLRALEVIASLSPLLGLLGTVLGMIEAFRQLAAAGSRVDPAVLSGGIWQALLTTAAGLGVAIPVVLLHSWLERRVERCAHQMEDAVTRVFTQSAIQPSTLSIVSGAQAVSPRAFEAAAVGMGAMQPSLSTDAGSRPRHQGLGDAA